MTKRIAPTLRRAHPRPLTPREVMQGAKRDIITYRADDAYREFAALLEVARSARALDGGPHLRTCSCNYCHRRRNRVRNALARLDRVSTPRPGGSR